VGEVTDERKGIKMLKDASLYYGKKPKIVKGRDFILLTLGNIKADLDEIISSFSIQLKHYI